MQGKYISSLAAGMLVLALALTAFTGGAQVYSNKAAGKKNEKLEDSLKHAGYDYLLPILGKKAAAKGFDLPYSAGISVNYFWQESDLIIDNLMVGFNNGTMYNMDELVRFDKATATAMALTVRPDLWIFPFLNVYGIFGRSSASTEVGFGVWIPDSTNTPKQVAHADSKVEFNATSMGFGFTPTVGIAGGWLALDMNFTWTDVPQLDKPAYIFVFGPRVGKTFCFKNPKRNIAVWAGGFRVKMNSGTTGSVNFSEVMPIDQWQTTVDQGIEKVAGAQQQVDSWWAGLTAAEQKNPVNIAKHEAANATLGKAGEVLNSANEAVATASTSSVQYSMDKRPKDMWNFILGSQFQFNKHLMVRAEVGFLSSRIQVNAGLQYRFGL